WPLKPTERGSVGEDQRVDTLICPSGLDTHPALRKASPVTRLPPRHVLISPVVAESQAEESVNDRAFWNPHVRMDDETGASGADAGRDLHRAQARLGLGDETEARIIGL